MHVQAFCGSLNKNNPDNIFAWVEVGDQVFANPFVHVELMTTDVAKGKAFYTKSQSNDYVVGFVGGSSTYCSTPRSPLSLPPCTHFDCTLVLYGCLLETGMHTGKGLHRDQRELKLYPES